jgi:hypothetical protein
MRVTNAPLVLWDHCMQLMSEIRSNTALNLFSLAGETPTTKLTGDMADISHLCEFSWYDPVWYINVTDPMQNKKLACYLGPSHDVGEAMCFKLLTVKGKVICRTSVIPLTAAERHDMVVKKQVDDFETTLHASLGDRTRGIEPELDKYEREEREFVPDEDDLNGPVTMPEADQFDHDAYLKFIAARVLIPVGGELREGRVVKRKRDEDGLLIGVANPNPLLDTSLYEVEFEDGLVTRMSLQRISLFKLMGTEIC